MNSKLRALISLSSLAVAIAVPGMAHAYNGAIHPRAAQVDQRIANLEMRVDQGVRSGALRPFEARHLRMQIATIRHNERVFMMDGRLDDREFGRLQHELDNVSQNVFVGKHNAIRR